MKNRKTLIRIVLGVIILAFVLYQQLFKQNSDSNDTEKIAGFDKSKYSEMVKREFIHAWNGYKKYAYGHDALKPLSKSFRDWYGESLYMTPVDAFDTMILMGLAEEANETKNLILENLSFDKNLSVQNFEITIRLLGGLISAYQLDGDQKFLDLAVDLADRLMPVFDSKTGIPYRYVHLQSGKISDKFNNPAEAGTLMLEFGTISKLTGDDKYYNAAKKALVEIFNRRSDIGLVGTVIDAETGKWINTDSHISGMIDSYYEYLIKSWILFEDDDFKMMFDKSINAVNTHLADITDSGLWYTYADMNTGEKLKTQFGALDAFFPAVLLLGGNKFRAEQLVESCYKMWKLHGIEPEQIDYSTMEVLSADYNLRPEFAESLYYLYNETNDEKYLVMGVEVLESLIKYCKTEDAYAALRNVITKEKKDDMESFLFAETFKYLFLLFAEGNSINLNDFVFNTEAHPIAKNFNK
ncbi:MAG: glycoside hydrolase family 47 protein [Melioribacteraceae bacterium]|nr:glycoside hydrolase family 47 protein [Melioribacteraceae bacterium]MCF8265743.1 glycoside hydrolase family 47 protein [Melioribacteraceae bacterium]